jgi:hypothetical protein
MTDADEALIPWTGGFHWLHSFVDYVGQNNLALDFVTFHTYGNGQAGKNYLDGIKEIRSWTAKIGRARIPLDVTEWGASWAGDGINLSPVAGAFTLEFLYRLAQVNITRAMFLLIRGASPGCGEDNPTLITYSGTKSHSYLAMELLNTLKGSKLAGCSTDQPDVNCVAGVQSGGSVKVVIWRVDWMNMQLLGGKTPQGVDYYTPSASGFDLPHVTLTGVTTARSVFKVPHEVVPVLKMGDYTFFTWTPPATPSQPMNNPNLFNAVSSDKPVSYWRLGESNRGKVADQTKLNPGETVGSVSVLHPGPSVNGSSSYFLNGGGSFVKVKHSSTILQVPITIETWVKPLDVGSYYTLLSSEGDHFSNTSGFGFRQRSAAEGNIFWFVVGEGGAGDAAKSITPAVAGQWYHLVGTYDGARIQFFINGKLESTFPCTRTLNSPNDLMFGSGTGATSGSENFNGHMSEITYYNKVLSPERIQVHFSAAFK